MSSGLTTKYLDKKLNELKDHTEKQISGLRTELKGEISSLRIELKTHTEDQISDLAGMMARRFDDLERKLDVREEVDQLKTQMVKVWDALGISQK